MKRFIASSILAAMLLQLASCGSNTPAETGANTAEPESITETENTTETETEQPEYSPATVTFDGADFTIAATEYPNPIYQSLNYCEAYGELTGDAISDALFERNNLIQDELDIKIQTHPFADIGTTPGTDLRQLVQAGETFVDLASLSGSSLPIALGGGILQNLLDVSTIDLSHSWYNSKTIDAFNFQNSLYAVSSDFNLYTAFSPVVVYINKQTMNSHNLENPYDMVNEGTWTFDKMISMAETAASDVNGNGKVDIREDYFGMLLEDSFMTSCVYASGTRVAAVNNDGIPEMALDIERATGVIDKMLPLFKNENVTIHANHVSGYGNVFKELFLPTFTEGRSLFLQNQLMMAMDMREMEAEFEILPHPKYDEAQSEYHNLVSEWWASFTTIPVTNSRLDMTGYVMEALGYYSQKLVTPAYVEKTIKGKVSRDEQSIQMVELILDTCEFELASLYDWGGVFSMFAQIGRNNNNNFASIFARKQTAFQKGINATLAELEAADNK